MNAANPIPTTARPTFEEEYEAIMEIFSAYSSSEKAEERELQEIRSGTNERREVIAAKQGAAPYTISSPRILGPQGLTADRTRLPWASGPNNHDHGTATVDQFRSPKESGTVQPENILSLPTHQIILSNFMFRCTYVFITIATQYRLL
jgi:hypothetical protein